MVKKLYAEPHRDVYAVVDDADYEYFRRWRWCKYRSKKGVIYLRRALTIGRTRDDESGKIKKINKTLYLHREILKRAATYPRSKFPQVAAHINGNALDCRRENLEWKRKKKNTVRWGGIAAYSTCIQIDEPALEEIPF